MEVSSSRPSCSPSPLPSPEGPGPQEFRGPTWGVTEKASHDPGSLETPGRWGPPTLKDSHFNDPFSTIPNQ